MPQWWENLKKDVDTIKKVGFKPTAAAADVRQSEATKQYGNQLAEDKKLSPMERRAKVQKGFENR